MEFRVERRGCPFSSPALFASLVLLMVAAGCGTNRGRGAICVSDDECGGAACVAGECVEADASIDDVFSDGGDAATFNDARSTTDVRQPDAGEQSDTLADVDRPDGIEGDGFDFDVSEQDGCLRVSAWDPEISGVALGSSTVRLLELENCGDSALTLISTQLAGPIRHLGLVDPIFLPTEPELRPAESVTLVVTIRALREGTFEGEIIVESDRGSASAPVRLEVGDTEDEQCFTVEPTEIDLGQLGPDEARSVDVVLENCGAGSLRVSYELAEGLTSVDELPSPFRAGQSFTHGLELSSTAGDVGVASEATVTYTSDLGTRSFVVKWTRVSTEFESCLELLPPVTELGEIPLGATFTAPIEIKNCGDGDVQVAAAELLTDGRSIVSTLRTDDEPLARGRNDVRMWAEISAEELGFHAIDYMLQSNDGRRFGPFRITATVFEEPEECLRFEPEVVDLDAYDEELLGQGSEAEISAVLRNCSESPVIITSLSSPPNPFIFPDGPFSARELGLPVEIPPGGEFEFEFWILGTRIGPIREVVEATTSRGLVSQLPVIGEVWDPRLPEGVGEVCVISNPTSLTLYAFPPVDGVVRSNEIELINCGERPWRVEDLEVTFPFIVSADTQWVQPGDGLFIEVGFHPDELDGSGARDDLRAVVRSDDGATAETWVPLRIINMLDESDRTRPFLVVVPDTIEFGSVESGREYERAFQLCNPGVGRVEFEIEEYGFTDVEVPANALSTGECIDGTLTFEVGSFDVPVSQSIQERIHFVPTLGTDVRATMRVSAEVNVPLEEGPCFRWDRRADEVNQRAFVDRPTTIPARFSNCGSETVDVDRVRVALDLSGGAILEIGELSVSGDNPLNPGESILVDIPVIARRFGSAGLIVYAEHVFAGNPGVRHEEVAELSVRALEPQPCVAALPDPLHIQGTIGEWVDAEMRLVNCGPVEITTGIARSWAGGSTELGELSATLLDPRHEEDTVESARLMPGESVDARVSYRADLPGRAHLTLEVSAYVGSSSRDFIQIFPVVTLDSQAARSSGGCFRSTPSSVAFGNVEPGSSPARLLELTNCGGEDQRLVMYGFLAGTNRAFSTVPPTGGLPLTLGPDDSTRSPVRVRPVMPGVYEGTYFMRTASGSQVNVPLFATATDGECTERDIEMSLSPEGEWFESIASLFGERVFLRLTPGAEDFHDVVWSTEERDVELTITGENAHAISLSPNPAEITVAWIEDNGCRGTATAALVARDGGVVAEWER